MNKGMSILGNKWFKFGVVLCIYLLWALWVESWWLLLGVPVIYDIYISKKVHWAFWKKKGVEKQTKVVEWIDALIFAIVAATLIRMFFFEAYTIPSSSMEKTMLVGDYLFVSKVSYGPKLPNTPLAVPFTHHTLPFTRDTKAYSEAVHWPYKRIAGTGEMKRTDIVVFNFPAGDTVIVGAENPDYYSQLRSEAASIDYLAREKGIVLPEGKAVDYTNFNLLSSWVNVTYGKKWRVGMFAGFAQNLGTNDALAAVDGRYSVYGRGFYAASQTYADRFWRAAVFGSFNLPKLSFNLEYNYTAVQYGTLQADGRTAGNYWAANQRVAASVFYHF